jgi:hypothetical protein
MKIDKLDVISGAVRLDSILSGYAPGTEPRYLGTVGVLTIITAHYGNDRILDLWRLDNQERVSRLTVAEGHALAAMLKDAP